MLYKIKSLETEPIRIAADLDDASMRINYELFKVIGSEVTHPYRVRLINTETGEVGPQIRMFTKLSAAAKAFDEQSITW